MLVSHVDWWSGFPVFEGRAELIHSGNADPEAESPWLVTRPLPRRDSDELQP